MCISKHRHACALIRPVWHCNAGIRCVCVASPPATMTSNATHNSATVGHVTVYSFSRIPPLWCGKIFIPTGAYWKLTTYRWIKELSSFCSSSKRYLRLLPFVLCGLLKYKFFNFILFITSLNNVSFVRTEIRRVHLHCLQHSASGIEERLHYRYRPQCGTCVPQRYAVRCPLADKCTRRRHCCRLSARFRGPLAAHLWKPRYRQFDMVVTRFFALRTWSTFGDLQ